MREVVMKMCMHTNNVFDKNTLSYFGVGGFTFTINGMDIPFDFDAYGCSCNMLKDKVEIIYTTGEGCVFNDYGVSDDFEEDYAQYGLKKDDITAHFLSSVTDILEIYTCFETAQGEELGYEWIIESIVFTDETGTEYPVAQSVLDAYNGTRTT